MSLGKRSELGLALASFSVVLCAATARVQASGNAIAHFGGEHGTVVTTNPTALYYNPAGIGFSEGTQLFLDGQLAIRSLSWTHAQSMYDTPEPAGFAGANYGTAKALNVFGGPMLGASFKLGDFAFGAAAYAPFGGSVHFDRNEAFANTMYPYAADGVARWHAYDASTMTIYGTLGVAYRLGPLSLGVSGNLAWTTLQYDRAQRSGAGLNDLAAEGRSLLDVSGVHGSFGVGAMWEVAPRKFWLAASYQAQPGLGAMQLNGTLELGMNGESGKQDVTFHQALPDIFRFGARYRPSEVVELRVAGDMTRWSVLKTQCLSVRELPCTVTSDGSGAPGSAVIVNLRRNWRDTFGVRGSGSYWIVPTLELFAGLGFETSAEPDSTLDPALADANNLLAALGGRLQLGTSWYVAASYTQLQFFDRDNTGLSQLADPALGAVTRRPDGGGQYRQWVGLVNANLTKTF
jgi:long-chain fatty acid transport protein